jgi:hypothetical protein
MDLSDLSSPQKYALHISDRQQTASLFEPAVPDSAASG